MTGILGSRRHVFLTTAWLALFVFAAYWISRPGPPLPVPEGWTHWPEVGAVYALETYRDGIMAGGSKGLWQIENGQAQKITGLVLPDQAIIQALVIPDRHHIWVGHTAGLSVYDGQQWNHYNESDGLPSPPVNAIVLNGDSAWIGGYGGLIKANGNPPWKKDAILHIAPSEQLPGKNISALMRDNRDGLWVGTNESPQGGVYRQDATTTRFWGVDNGLPHPQVTSLYQDESGRVWAGTGFYNRGGAAVFKAGKDKDWTIERTLIKAQLAGPKVRSISQDNRGHFWIGSENHGVAIRDESGLIHILDDNNGLPGPEVTKILQTRDGAVWLATLKGMARISPEALSTLDAKGGKS